MRRGCRVAPLAALAAASVCLVSADTPAERLIAAGHWKRARALVEADARAHPNNALNYCLLSQIRHAFGDNDTPLHLAEKAVELDGAVAKYHRQLAEVTGVMAQYANPVRLLVLARRFRKELDTAIALDPKDALALRDLMEYYLRAPGIAGGDATKATELVERIAAADAEEGWLARERIARHRKQPVAGILDAAVGAVPSSYRLRIAAAEAALERRDPAAAEGYARAAMVIDAGRVDAYSIVARALAGRAHWSELETLLDSAERAVPDDLTPCYRAAEVLLENSANTQLAEHLLRKYTDSQPEGNAPAREDARRKLSQVLAKTQPAE